MSRTTLSVLAASGPNDRTLLRAPKVGVWSDPPRDGAFVEAGSTLGTLTQVRRRFVLTVPEGVSGRVELLKAHRGAVAVEYGELLLHVARVSADTIGSETAAAGTSVSTGGLLVITAPTDGVFYRSPATGAPPYIAAGDRVVTGQAVGLIEVMKTFNPIVYGGPSLPDEAEVVEVLVADGAEIRAGQSLVGVKTL
jgi:biotin carboxyl carrier protein